MHHDPVTAACSAHVYHNSETQDSARLRSCIPTAVSKTQSIRGMSNGKLSASGPYLVLLQVCMIITVSYGGRAVSRHNLSHHSPTNS